MPERNFFRGDMASPRLCADGLAPSSPSPNFPLKIPNAVPQMPAG